MERRATRIKVYENENPIIRWRVWDQHEADYLTTVAGSGVPVETIYWEVFNDAGTSIASLPYDADDLLYDTLQTGAEWTRDRLGYNFEHRFPWNVFTEGARNYRVEYRFLIYDTGDVVDFIREIPFVFDVQVIPLKSV